MFAAGVQNRLQGGRRRGEEGRRIGHGEDTMRARMGDGQWLSCRMNGNERLRSEMRSKRVGRQEAGRRGENVR